MKPKLFIGSLLTLVFIVTSCSRKPETTLQVNQQSTPSVFLQNTGSTAQSEATTTHSPTPTSLPQEPPPSGAELEFSTDFSKHTVPYREILSGGPPKDGIPAIDETKFVGVNEADNWLEPVEPVILVEAGGEAKAYPLQILTWHEIVNDAVGDIPLIITFCPLCNTAIAFERTFYGQVLDFGTTGRLRYSNLIMYDRQTETWWQQASGEAIAGKYAGSQLKFFPAVIISWQDFRSEYPEGLVLSRETGFNRAYGSNPYTGYDNVNNPPFLYDGPETPGALPPVARVLTVDLNGEAVAYPYDILKEMKVVNDNVGEQPIVVFWKEGTASALDSALIADGRDVGAAAAYSRDMKGSTLNFKVEENRILDKETGSEWNVLGQAIEGKLKGKQLSPIVAINHFWFSWAAFKPETSIYKP